MAYSHNCLLRGLNAIILQAPHVPPAGSPGYSARDVRDLLFYVASWVKTVEWHHHTEETCMFPGIEAFTGQPGIMDGPKGQHEEFTPGLERLLRYAQETKPEDYRWEGPGGMKEIIDSFAPSLTKHLYEEIDVFLAFGHLDSEGLRRCWDEAEEVAKAKGKLYMLVGCLPAGWQGKRVLTKSSPLSLPVRRLPLRAGHGRQDLRGRQSVSAPALDPAVRYQVLVRGQEQGRMEVQSVRLLGETRAAALFAGKPGKEEADGWA